MKSGVVAVVAVLAFMFFLPLELHKVFIAIILWAYVIWMAYKFNKRLGMFDNNMTYRNVMIRKS